MQALTDEANREDVDEARCDRIVSEVLEMRRAFSLTSRVVRIFNL